MIQRFRPILCSIAGGTFLACLLVGTMFAARPANAQVVQPNGITAPEPGAVLAGVILVQGTAAHPDFLRFELSFYKEFDPYAGWIVFAEGSQPVISGTLAVWDTTVGRATGAPVFPDGLYRLRLRVVRRDYNYDELFVTGLRISNDSPTPTPTVTETATPTPGVPPAGGAGLATPGGLSSSPVEAPLLPSLTPFPTPSPLPSAAAPAAAVRPKTEGGDPVREIVAGVQNLDTDPLLRAAWFGVRVTAWLFSGLAIYLSLRWLGRRLWLGWLGRRRGKIR